MHNTKVNILYMIFYFSGTGNSKWIAREVAAYQHEKIISIADEMVGFNNTLQYTIHFLFVPAAMRLD